MKPGYKQTEIGVIPEDWEINSLGQKAEIFRGGSPRPIQDYLTNTVDGVNWIKIGDVPPDGKYIITTEERIRPEGVSKSRAVHSGDFVLSNSMSYGRPYILATDGCIHDGWLTIQNYQNTFFTEYLYYMLSSDAVLNQYAAMADGSGVKNLNKEKVASLVVAFPSTTSEQRRIAEALSDMDELISSLEKLIAKKKAIKQGAMQELLTGKRRLPGFSRKWKILSLSEIGHFVKGTGISRADVNSGNLPAVRYGELYTRHDNYVKEYYSQISFDVALTAVPVTYGSILFAASGETKEEIGKCAAIIDDHIVYAGGDILIFIPDKPMHPVFFGTLLNTPEVCKQKAQRGQGDAIVHIHADSLSKIRVTIPEYEEQTAIANILLSIDRELDLLETKVTKARQVKQGMMQQLLSGMIRL